MSEYAQNSLYYVLDKQSGTTSAPLSWQALEQGLASQQWDSSSPVTQEGAEGWCTLEALILAGLDAKVSDILFASRPKAGFVSRMMRLLGRKEH